MPQQTQQDVLPSRPTLGRRIAIHGFFGTTAVCSAVSLLFFAVYWLVNLNRATGERLPWLSSFLRQQLPEDLFQFLDGLSRDASTVTSMLGVILSFYVLRAAASYFWSRAALTHLIAANRKSFPFPLRYQITWVQLGLIGTLWSFLLIGGQLKLGMDPVESVTILVLAFGTALLSTFSGVVGAYIVAPLIVTGFQRVCAAADLLPPRTPTEALDKLTSGIEELGRNSMATARLLASGTKDDDPPWSLQEATVSLCETLDDLRERLTDVEGPLKQAIDQLVSRILRGQEERIDRLETAMTASQIALGESIRQGLASLGQGIERGHIALGEELRQALSSFAATVGESQREGLTALGDRLDAHAQSLRDGHEGLEESLQRLSENLPRLIEAHQLELAEKIEGKIEQTGKHLAHLNAQWFQELCLVPLPRLSVDAADSLTAKAEAGSASLGQRWRSYLKDRRSGGRT